MRIAIFGESAADETILGSLIDAAGVRSLDLVSKPSLRSRGWPSVRDLTPTVIRHVHYQTEATGLVVMFDSNGSVVHAVDHESVPVDDCRTCDVLNAVTTTLDTLSPVQDRPPLRVSVVTAVPAIEAWLLAVDDHQVSEAAKPRGSTDSCRATFHTPGLA